MGAAACRFKLSELAWHGSNPWAPGLAAFILLVVVHAVCLMLDDNGKEEHMNKHIQLISTSTLDTLWAVATGIVGSLPA